MTVCRTHGGAIGRVRQAAEVRVLQARVMQNIGQAIVEYNGDVTIDPLQSLMRMVQSAAWAERAYAEKIRDDLGAPTCRGCGQPKLEKACQNCGDMKMPYPAGITVRVGSAAVGYKDEPHAILKLWNEERDRLAKFSKLALDAGIEEKQVKLAQAQVELTATALDAALDAAGIKQEQRFDILQDMARRLNG